MSRSEPRSESCPLCGHDIVPLNTVKWDPKTGLLMRGAKMAQFTRQQSHIFNLIWRSGVVGITPARMISLLWEGNSDGGPDTATNVIYTQMRFIRDKIAPLRLDIAKGIGRAGFPYILLDVDAGSRGAYRKRAV